jgi:hypothetical protein
LDRQKRRALITAGSDRKHFRPSPSPRRATVAFTRVSYFSLGRIDFLLLGCVYASPALFWRFPDLIAQAKLHTVTFILGLLLVLATLLDAFETILLPRRINHRFRYSRLYYRNFWWVWRAIARRALAGKWREAMLGAFGPFSLLGLFASWIATLILGFTLAQWSLASLQLSSGQNAAPHSFETYLYFSGTTYFTLGLGDVIPAPGPSRLLTVIESGLGFGFLAIIISYLPVLYQAFSRREVAISLLDARAGSPPTGGEFLKRRLCNGKINIDVAVLREWERWCAELLESQISFPVLAYYRSQHANQSWLAALASLLDTCSILLTVLPPGESHQAQLTFAMARHAAVDIGLVFRIGPPKSLPDRLPDGVKIQIGELLRQIRPVPQESLDMDARFAQLRGMYEPFLQGLAEHFVLSLPPVAATEHVDDNWQRSAWLPRTPGIGDLSSGESGGDHFY